MATPFSLTLCPSERHVANFTMIALVLIIFRSYNSTEHFSINFDLLSDSVTYHSITAMMFKLTKKKQAFNRFIYILL